ncbi:hypothetical protein CPB85DRAFT_1269019 [Mucidula mucida]|nr:hypothetical protein CPB85DRAFT_1269019 [Mucidula mucida]
MTLALGIDHRIAQHRHLQILIMSVEEDTHQSSVPSLSWFCQRVAGKYVEGIADFGPDLSLRYDLLQPILERCSVDDLSRLEQTVPQIACKTEDLWKALCSKNYPIESELYGASSETTPESWRDHYFVLKEWANKRFEAIGSKMRNQRQAFESQKKEREVKFSNIVPPRERKSTHSWGQTRPAQTAMQKIKSTVTKQAKICNTPYKGGITAKDYRNTPVQSFLSEPRSGSTRRAAVSIVNIPQARKPGASKSSSSSSSSSPSPPPRRPIRPILMAPPPSTPAKRKFNDSTASPPIAKQGQDTPSPVRPIKRQKKDPMAALFLPKDRAYSQRPQKVTG